MLCVCKHNASMRAHNVPLGTLNMHRSDFCIKINNTEATFLHQLAIKFNKGTFCIVDPMSCQCELSAGMYNRWCSQCAVIISTSERSDNGFR